MLLGPEALDGGTRTVAVGLGMHFGVAVGWSAVFLFLVMRARWIRGLLATPFGILKVAFFGHIPFVAVPMIALGTDRRRPSSEQPPKQARSQPLSWVQSLKGDSVPTPSPGQP